MVVYKFIVIRSLSIVHDGFNAIVQCGSGTLGLLYQYIFGQVNAESTEAENSIMCVSERCTESRIRCY